MHVGVPGAYAILNLTINFKSCKHENNSTIYVDSCVSQSHNSEIIPYSQNPPVKNFIYACDMSVKYCILSGLFRQYYYSLLEQNFYTTDVKSASVVYCVYFYSHITE